VGDVNFDQVVCVFVCVHDTNIQLCVWVRARVHSFLRVLLLAGEKAGLIHTYINSHIHAHTYMLLIYSTCVQVREKAGLITPVPGGVGPMTIAMLMKNAVALARQQLSGGHGQGVEAHNGF
jgi:hypothetical protein